jgi:uncharacterized protein YndB with AHSA1/START domain
MSKFTSMAATAQTLSLTAMEEASRRGQREADIDHLFLALVINDQVAGQVLRGIGITLDAARAAVAAQHSAQLESIGITAEIPDAERIVFHETGGYEWSRRALDIFKRATDDGRNGDAAAVLRELVAEPSGMIEHLLRRLGTSPAEVLARLDETRQIPAHSPRAAASGALSGFAETFVPAPVQEVWAMLANPSRMPEWEPGTGSVEPADNTARPRLGDTWVSHARTHRPDGKPLKIKPEFQRRQVELLEADEGSLIAWRFSYPAAARANSRYIRINLDPAAGGTQLGVTLAWERSPERRHRHPLGPLARPWHRFAIWMHLAQVGGSISRAFR